MSVNASVEQHWSADVFKKWIEGGLLKPDEERFNMPDQDITRGQFIALVNRVFNYSETKDNVFVDKRAEAWYSQEVAKLPRQDT